MCREGVRSCTSIFGLATEKWSYSRDSYEKSRDVVLNAFTSGIAQWKAKLLFYSMSEYPCFHQVDGSHNEHIAGHLRTRFCSGFMADSEEWLFCYILSPISSTYKEPGATSLRGCT